MALLVPNYNYAGTNNAITYVIVSSSRVRRNEE
jgi:hypothetical protein